MVIALTTALAFTARPVSAASAVWTNTGDGAVGYWTNNANWNGASYPGYDGTGQSAGINSSTPNTYTCILDAVARYFPDYVDVDVRNGGGGLAWLVVTNGGAFAAYHGGLNTGGRVVVSGPGSRAGKFQAFNIGGIGASMRIENGGSFYGQNSTFGVYIGGHEYGGNPGTNCSLVVTGPGSTFTNNWGAHQTQVGYGAGSVSNGVRVLDGGKMVTTITLGSEASSLTVSGPGSTFEGAFSLGGVNTLVFVGDGGVLDVNTLDTGTGAGNRITNSGGVYQFTTAAPTITTNAGHGSIVLNGGTISHRNVSSGLDLDDHFSSQLNRMTWMGNNALRLNNSVLTSGLGYTFNTGLSVTNWCRLEMVSGTNRVNNLGFNVGTNGGLVLSNATVTIVGAVTNAGRITFHNSSVSFSNRLALLSGSVFLLTGTNNLPMTVGGTLTVPANASVDFPASTLPRKATVVLFTASTVDAPGSRLPGWTMPSTHRARVVENTVVIEPVDPGFVLIVH